ncbi:MAG TPA: hypothetical protein VJU61_00585 [Polyangiaceae bacterium]|nr:hypothetical protein [Polyangiaceae bacterium]
MLTLAARIAASFATVLPLTILELPFELPPVRGSMLWHERHSGDPAHAWFRQRLAAMVTEVQALPAWAPRSAVGRRSAKVRAAKAKRATARRVT